MTKPERLTLGQRFTGLMDRMIFAVAPEMGSRRIMARKAFEVADRQMSALADRQSALSNRQHEGADTTGRLHGERWLTHRLSPDSALEADLDDARDHAEELYRNDAYMRSYCEGRVAQEVGSGIRPQAQIRELAGVVTDERASQHNEQLEGLFRRWEPHAQVNGSGFFLAQRAVDRDLSRFGEAFVVLAEMPDRHRAAPLAVEVIHPKRISTPPDKQNDPLCRLGVQRDGDGRILGFHVQVADPDDTIDNEQRWEFVPKYLPGSTGRAMCHVYEPLLAGQSRGLPDATPVLNELRDLKDYKEATLIAAQVEACMVAFISTKGRASGAAAGAAHTTRSDGERLQHMRPGQIMYGSDGDDIKFNSPTRPAPIYDEFLRSQLRSIGAGLGYSYELLARDWSQSNYSSTRLSLIDARKIFNARRQLIVDCFCRPVWERLTTFALVAGILTLPPRHFERLPSHFLASSWIGERQDWIDPEAEVAAAVEAINNNLDTKANVLTARGLDPEEVLAQRRREMEQERDLLPQQEQTRLQETDEEADDEATDEA